MYWIPPTGRAISHDENESSGIQSVHVTKTINDVSGVVNIGLTIQLLHRKKPKLKIGAMYSYGWRTSREFSYDMTYAQHDFAQENFKVNTGEHRFLLSLKYPIIVYRNTTQKNYIL